VAALSEARAPELVDLRELHPEDLDFLLAEEGYAWRSLLSWDFSASADLVRRFINIQALNGFALMVAGKPAGYCYFVCEERKALIGDLYVLREFASSECEDLLLSAVLKVLLNTPYLHRVEAQLLMMRGACDRQMPFGQFLRVQPRIFMMAETDNCAALQPGRAATQYAFQNWDERRQDEAANVIARAYQGHVDATINDQYRSLSGAKRFLTNIVQYPGCGVFHSPASFHAEDTKGQFAGLSLASSVAQGIGHITQICVTPEVKHTGVGYELLRRSLCVFAAEQCEKVSLTVTASNVEAITLYQRVGFRALRRFGAFVWEGF
jgi:ribosomal protein S18 acetylase RimI-like enzyme